MVFGCVGALAQIDTGTVVGKVLNPAGDGAAGAKVYLKNEGASITKTTYARADGSFTFSPVKVGVYSVSVELQGFVPTFQGGVVVDIQQRVEVNFKLVATQAASGAAVTSGSSASYEPEPADKVITSEQIQTLPVSQRNLTFLAQLIPGTSPPAQAPGGLAMTDSRNLIFLSQAVSGNSPRLTTATDLPGSTSLSATGSFAANGNQPYQTNYVLDGADDNTWFLDFLPGTSYQVLPAMDAVEEFKVETPVYDTTMGGSSGAVVNVRTKSGTNEFHGSAWDFFGNDRLDAADYFDNAAGLKRAELRKNIFGATLGGPVDLGNFYNGKNKTFFFASYQGAKYRQGVPSVATVPTVTERNSGFTDFSDLISGQPKCTTGPDVLGRTVSCGTIFDPATTRFLATGQMDPITKLTPSATGYAREPFAGNLIPAKRIDPVAAALLDMFPVPSTPAIYNNYSTNAFSRGDSNQFDIRADHYFSDHNQVFGRFSFLKDPQLQDGPFAGYADGGGYTQTPIEVNGVLSITHVSSPTLIHDFRLAANRMALQRIQAFGNDLTDIPAQLGIFGIPQYTGNGGMPSIGVGIYSQLGSSPYTPVIDYNTTYQISEGFTKIRGGHIFKGGAEAMQIKAATDQPPYSRGAFDFSGNYTSIANALDPSTGVAQFLLTPGKSSVSFGRDYVGGPNQVLASNITSTFSDLRRLYYGVYLQDQWKYRPDLTITLGGRWEYFQPWKEWWSAEANFIPGSSGNAKYLIPAGRGFDTQPCGPQYPTTCVQSYLNTLSTSFTDTLTADSISLDYPRRGGVIQVSKRNFAPRLGFAYQYSPQVVVRGGIGLYYGGLENQGGQANFGGNYPFQVNYDFTSPDDGSPIVYPTTLSYATLEQGLAPVPLSPNSATADELELRGIQQAFKTPYVETATLMVEYKRANHDLIQIGYVGTDGKHLLINPGVNEVGEMLPPFEQRQAYEPYLNFAYASSYLETEGVSKYNSGQVQYVRQLAQGLSFLANYTWSTTRTDALDFFNIASPQTYRAPAIQAFGITGDYQQADFAVRNAVHFSGGYELPFGPGKQFLAEKGAIEGKILGNWTLNWIVTVQSGQPVTIPCSITTASGVGCDALMVNAENVNGPVHNANQYWNPVAFYNPAVATSSGQTNLQPLGGAPAQVIGPPLRRLDAALHRSFQVTENVRAEVRAEVYNATNHPFFAQPTNLNFMNTTLFGRINSTRDNPNDARQIQFAVKFYF